jgi:hypothetical protein
MVYYIQDSFSYYMVAFRRNGLQDYWLYIFGNSLKYKTYLAETIQYSQQYKQQNKCAIKLDISYKYCAFHLYELLDYTVL